MCGDLEVGVLEVNEEYEVFLQKVLTAEGGRSKDDKRQSPSTTKISGASGVLRAENNTAMTDDVSAEIGLVSLRRPKM